MSMKIKWISNNSIAKGYRIYKSNTYFDEHSLPPVLAETSPDAREWIDVNASEGDQNWYMVGTFIENYEVFSKPFMTGASTILMHEIFGSESGIVVTLPLISTSPHLDFTDMVVLSLGFQEENGFSIPSSPVVDGSYSNRINVSTTRDIKSYSLWYKSYGITGGSWQYLIDHRFEGGSGYLTVSPSGVSNSNNVIDVRVDKNLPLEDAFDGEWRHVYVEFTSASKSFTVGGRFGSTTYNSSGNGLFRFIRAFDRPLTDDEIEFLYQEGKPYT